MFYTIKNGKLEEYIYPVHYMKSEKSRLKKLIDSNLYNLFKEFKCFLAGGAITSLFTGADINDLDIYFRSEKDLAKFIYSAWTEYGLNLIRFCNTTKRSVFALVIVRIFNC